MADDKLNPESAAETKVLPPAPIESDGQDKFPEELPLLPLSDVVLFPAMVAPLIVSTPQSIKLIDDVVSTHRLLITVLQKDRAAADNEVAIEDLYEYGCVARLVKMLKFPDETVRILVQGLARCRVIRPVEDKSYRLARYSILKDEKEDTIEMAALSRNASQRFQEIITLSPTLPEELKVAVFNIDDPGKLADLISSHLNIPLEDQQYLLQEYRPKQRLSKLTLMLGRELEVLRLGSEIQNKVSESLSKTQRDFFLREQMKAIKKELGENDQQQMDLQDLDEKIARAKMSPEAEAAAKKEKERLQAIPPASPEYTVARTYLDWLIELPWSAQTEDVLDIAKAKRILDQDHYDLVKIKDRILEYLAVLKLKRDMKGPILCFVGPPGVGKTSLGQSIARALGRKFVRMSLGGVRDEAEIRGHRRTYVGAMPGRIIQGLRKAGTRNPVFMLDEIDKLGVDFRGDPSSALLEVLDPAQNSTFSDNYLNLPFDLSSVLFITTGNILDTMPLALRDRMETLELSGYTLTEKRCIAQKYLIPRQLKEHGLTRDNLDFSKDAVEQIIADYTREAGVRNLEREIANVCRKVARAVAEGHTEKAAIIPARLHKYLGAKQYELEIAEQSMNPGVATGLAWTPAGGDILFIEATQMPGKGALILTGSLGDVMKESAQAALSFVRANAKKLKIDKDFARKTDFHIHVPSGGIPKDGPSAGLAMVVALVSLVTGKAIPAHIAMTGEITLRGKVMPIGGVKEKVLAASRSGIRCVMMPERNKRNLEEIPAEVRKKVKIRLVKTAEEALRFVFGKDSNDRRKK